jgi:hypothetical protein
MPGIINGVKCMKPAIISTSLPTSNEEDLLTYDVFDEALETAGENEIAGNYTLGACTGLSVCPG